MARHARTSFVGALNAEVDFLRSWGLTPSRLRRLLAAAAARKQSPREYVKALLREAALNLPPATLGRSRPTHLPKLGRRTTLFLSGLNHAAILQDCPTPREFNSVLMAGLAFAEHYELHPDLLVALDAEATCPTSISRTPWRQLHFPIG